VLAGSCVPSTFVEENSNSGSGEDGGSRTLRNKRILEENLKLHN